MELRDWREKRSKVSASSSRKNSFEDFDEESFGIYFYDGSDLTYCVERIFEYYISFLNNAAEFINHEIRGPYRSDGDPFYLICNTNQKLRIVGLPNLVMGDSFIIEDISLGRETFTNFKEYIQKQLDLEEAKETDDEDI